MTDQPNDKGAGKPAKPVKTATAAQRKRIRLQVEKKRAAAAAAAANDREGDEGEEREPERAEVREAEPEPVAPLWDLPEQGVRIPLAALNYTVVYRLIVGDDGKQQRAHCGTLAPDATASAIKRQYGPGRYFIQARIGQRIVGGRELIIDGPEHSANLPFGPIGELPSGLVTLTQGDPLTAALLAMGQVWIAQQRQDFQQMLAMQQSTLEKLATQHGSSIVATHLREQLAASAARVRALEEDRDKLREREADHEREKLKARYKGDKTDWVEVAQAVGEMAPAVLEALPPKIKGFLENLVGSGGGGGGRELPAGVTEHPAK